MKRLYPLVIVGLGLCFGGANINSANASELIDTNVDNILITQLRGHDIYDGSPQMQWENYMLGRVVGKSGGWMSIKAEDGTVFQAEGFVRPGSNVLVGKDDVGKYYLVSATEAEWISVLEEDYSWKRSSELQASLNERTAAIWAEIEASSNRTATAIPEREVPESNTQVIESIPDNTPVRGLW